MEAGLAKTTACRYEVGYRIPEGESPLLRYCFRRGIEVVAQLDRASDCGSEGRRFESSQPHIPMSYYRKITVSTLSKTAIILYNEI